MRNFILQLYNFTRIPECLSRNLASEGALFFLLTGPLMGDPKFIAYNHDDVAFNSEGYNIHFP